MESHLHVVITGLVPVIQPKVRSAEITLGWMVGTGPTMTNGIAVQQNPDTLQLRAGRICA